MLGSFFWRFLHKIQPFKCPFADTYFSWFLASRVVSPWPDDKLGITLSLIFHIFLH